MKIGICGGTFDPFHRGHLEPIVAVRRDMEWDRVLYIPAWVQPFKQEQRTESPFHRFTMAVLGTEETEFLYVSPQELERGAISYTVDTLQQLRSEHGQSATLDWIIGDDNLAKLLEWKSIDRIFELANFVVLSRNGTAALPPQLANRVSQAGSRRTHGGIVFAQNATVPVSSTEIRRRARAGESIEELVGAPVAHYIHHYGLYRKDRS